jgi:hypothetical protein
LELRKRLAGIVDETQRKKSKKNQESQSPDVGVKKSNAFFGGPLMRRRCVERWKKCLECPKVMMESSRH